MGEKPVEQPRQRTDWSKIKYPGEDEVSPELTAEVVKAQEKEKQVPKVLEDKKAELDNLYNETSSEEEPPKSAAEFRARLEKMKKEDRAKILAQGEAREKEIKGMSLEESLKKETGIEKMLRGKK